MRCRAPPRDPLARTLTSSTLKPVLRSRRLKFGFGDDDSGLCPEYGKRGAKREAHAQSTDQYLRSIAGLNPLANNCSERLFGAAETTVHQFVVTQHNREFDATPHETEFAACWHLCL